MTPAACASTGMRPLLIAVCLLAFPASSSAATYKITHKSHTRVRHIGALPVYGAKGTIAKAKSVYGAPTSLQQVDSATCDGSWDALGLKLRFEAKHPVAHPCKASGGAFAVSFIASGHDFATHKGLHPGDAESKLHQLYPNAPSTGGFDYVIESVFINGVKTDVIHALVIQGAVSTLSGSTAEAALV